MMSNTTHNRHPLIGEVYMVKFDGRGFGINFHETNSVETKSARPGLQANQAGVFAYQHNWEVHPKKRRTAP